MRIAVVAGALANKPLNGGEAWVRLSWARGLERLGFRVYLVEQIDPRVCAGPEGEPRPFPDSVNLKYFRDVTERFGFGDRAALICGEGEEIHGISGAELTELAGDAEVLVNISGHLRLRGLFERFRRRAYIDLDPGFTQYWHVQGIGDPLLAAHDFHFTVGENVGCPGCSIPTDGIRWQPVRQPVVLSDWPVAERACTGRFTTIGSWRGPFGPVQHAGRTFGLKVHEFRKFIELPGESRHKFEIALKIHPGDRGDLERLRAHGWNIVDPLDLVPEPVAFRSYVQGSDAEFSVAQGIYVDTWSGWFSDRSVRYLAAGKPVLVQDTGFGRTYPVGEGVVSFTTLSEAVQRADGIMAEYGAHSRAARALAERFFDSDVALGAFLDRMDLAA